MWWWSLHLLSFYAALVAAASQCRLVAPAHVRYGHGSGSSSSSATGTANGATGATTTTLGSATVGGSVTTSASGAGASASATSLPAFNYGKTPVRGVNLGGWFVLEPWITPSIFEGTGNTSIVDEFTLGQSQNNDTTVAMLQNHWDTWITEDDFAAIAAAGLNHVRIPLGYWSAPMTSADTNYTTDVHPYIAGAWPYLLCALDWAVKHNLYTIVDIHGAPGSQNGYDNSGQRTTPKWALDDENVARTVDLVAFVAKELGDKVSIIQLLNEAGGWAGDAFVKAIRQYWLDGYQSVRNTVGGRVKVMIGDAFLGVSSWEDFMNYPQYQGVYMDWHMYQVFSQPELARSFDQHVSYACSLIPNLSNFSSGSMWTIVGEWSNAPTDCAKWLNGRGVGARWDGTWQNDLSIHFGSCDGYTGSYSTFSDDYKKFLRKYYEAQVAVGESAIGWVFWAWKAENADDWSYQKGLEGGWIPQDPDNRLYPDICS